MPRSTPRTSSLPRRPGLSAFAKGSRSNWPGRTHRGSPDGARAARDLRGPFRRIMDAGGDEVLLTGGDEQLAVLSPAVRPQRPDGPGDTIDAALRLSLLHARLQYEDGSLDAVP